MELSESNPELRPDVISFGAIINAECQVGNLQQVKRLLDLMESMGVEADLSLRNTVLSGIASIHGFFFAKKEVEMMVSQGHNLDTVSYIILMRCANNEGNRDELCEIIKKGYQGWQDAE